MVALADPSCGQPGDVIDKNLVLMVATNLSSFFSIFTC